MKYNVIKFTSIDRGSGFQPRKKVSFSIKLAAVQASRWAQH
jgi:hypothetical protein